MRWGSFGPLAFGLGALTLSAIPSLGGDILRHGGSVNGTAGASGSVAASGTSTPIPSNPGTLDSLRRTAAAIQAVQTMQKAARAAAASAIGANNLGINPNNPGQTLPDVSDGLASPQTPVAGEAPAGPGLRVAVDVNGNPMLWQGAGAPTPANANQGEVIITQSRQQALLEWQTFDIGKNTSLTFDQSAGGANSAQWIAFNFVRDPSGRPSQILGTLATTNGLVDAAGNPEVGGQIYVISANGIIFGGTSQVNVGALVASSLPINTNLIQRGLLNNPDAQFLFSTVPIASGSNGPTPTFDPSVAVADAAPAQTPFAGDGSGVSGEKYGDVVVQEGSTLTAPSSAGSVGGKIALIGPNVANEGTVSSPDGQVILAAGLQVGFAAHPTKDASLRGLDVYVGALATPASGNPPLAGNVTNGATGMIDAPRADVMLAGATVNQLGVISSDTSVSFNGRIDLLAEYDALSSGGAANEPPFFFTATGNVVLGSGSVSQVLPELSDPGTIAGTTFQPSQPNIVLALPSVVNIQGATVEFQGAGASSPGATLFAPNAQVTINAGTWRFLNGGINPSTGSVLINSAEHFVFDTGQIALETGAVVDVSGSENVSASVTENIISVQLTGTELADSPVQRAGPLRGTTIEVDIRDTGTFDGQPWIGTPLADTSGYVGLIQRTVGELTVDGGSVSLNAGGSVDVQNGSRIDVSGGWINYQGAFVQTTKLLTSNGKIVDISQATPNLVYQGIYTGTTSTTDSKWNATQTTTNPLPLGVNESGYTQGGDAGSISITAPAMTLEGGLFGLSFPGAHQTNPFSAYGSPTLLAVTKAGLDPRVWELENQPMSGTLSLVFEGQYAVSGASNEYASYLPAPPNIYIESSGISPPSDPTALVLSSSLVNPAARDYAGFGNLTIDDSADSNKIDSNGNLVVDPVTGMPASALYATITVAANSSDPGNVAIKTSPGGSLNLDAGNIIVDGGIVAPGGQINLTAHNFWENSPYNVVNFGIPSYNPERGNVSLANGVQLNTAGLIVDDRTVGDDVAAVTAGGMISIAGSSVTLGPQSTLNVDGGGVIGSNSKVAYGVAGSISIKAGADPHFGEILGGALNVNASDQVNLVPTLVPLEGYSGSAGGTLTIEAPLIQVQNESVPPMENAPPGSLVLPANFFNHGGFSSFALDGIGSAETNANGQTLTDGAGNSLYYPAIYVTPGTQIHPRVQAMEIISNSSGVQTEILEPFAFQQTPVSLTFNAIGAVNPLLTGINAILARGDLLIGAGALIETDPQSNPALGVKLIGQTVAELGTVVVPGGFIAIKGGADSSVFFAGGSSTALPTVDLGPQSYLSTAGMTVLTTDFLGVIPGVPGYINTGSVLNGGTITVDGNIAAEKGAKLDVSGWSDANDPNGLLNFPPNVRGSPSPTTEALGVALTPTVVASNGGNIAFTGRQELYVDASLRGVAGGPGAAGGGLSIFSGAFNALTPLVPTLLVTESDDTIPGSFYGVNQTAIGHAVLDKNGNPAPGMGHFAADSFTNGGFASLVLGGTVEFHGQVSISAANSLTVGTSGVIFADGEVDLSAGYVALGQAYTAPVLQSQEPPPFLNEASPFYFEPTSGAGTLNISAGSANARGLIDVGFLSLQTIGQATLAATGGDIRGFGTMDIAGNLTLTAGQVYAPTDKAFTLAAYEYSLPGDASGAPAHPGSITLIAAGDRQIPLSAGSTLNVYASIINQGGNLEAPIGTINLGWDGSGASPIDTITNAAVPVTQRLTLEPGSTTSVSGALVDPTSGQNLSIPYGLVINGTSWIDPTGSDITSGGLPAKSLTLSAAEVVVNAGSLIETSGGGDLYAYEFIPGTGGTTDTLSASSGSFAVIPGYQAHYAPYAIFNPNPSTSAVTNFASGDLGYTSVDSNGNSNLAVGEQVRLNLNNGQGTQAYTLLPARYALLPGAYLVTPVGGEALPPTLPVVQPDGSSVVSGYRFNAFKPTQPLYSEFEVAPSSVVRSEAQYTDYSANAFFGSGGQSSTSVRLPIDSGQLNILTSGSLSLLGAVGAAPGASGRGGLVEISSSEDIVINDSGTGSASGTLYLSSTELSGFNSGSLLIGGTSSTGADGTLVSVAAGNLTVDNAGDPLTGSDIILVANQSLNLAAGANIQSSGTSPSPAGDLVVSDSLNLQPASEGFITLAHGGVAIDFPDGTPTGDTIKSSVGATITVANGKTSTLTANTATILAAASSVTLSSAGRITAGGTGILIPVTLGDGALLRVSSDVSAQSTRSGVSSSTAPTLRIGADAFVVGASVTLDSTNLTIIDPTAVLGGAVSISSGKISLVFDSSLLGSIPENSLVLTGTALSTLQARATALSMLSYSSIDTYGSGQIGSPSFTELVLDSAEIRGFQAGANGDVVLAAQTITLENELGGTGPGAAYGATLGGTLSLEGGTVNMGANNLSIDQFANVQIIASGGVLEQGSGGLTTTANLKIVTPLISAVAGAVQKITSDGNLEIDALPNGTAAVSGGIGASLTLVGSSIAENGDIMLPSGVLALHATGAAGSGANLTVAGTLDVSGAAKTFNNATNFSDGGKLFLDSDNGSVALQLGASVNVSARQEGGKAGSLSVSAVNGTFTLASGALNDLDPNGNPIPTLDGRNGQGAVFSLDVSKVSDSNALSTQSLGYVEGFLTAGGFSASQTIRVRTGDVAVDGLITARTFNLSADQGSIDVTENGFIDASGATGGSIELDAARSVTLETRSELSVRGQNFNDAARGGTVTLQAGAYTAGSAASPARARGSDGVFGSLTPVVDIQQGATIDLSVVNDHPLELDPAGSGMVTVPADVGVYFPSGTPGNNQISFSSAGTVTTSTGLVIPFTATALIPFKTTLTPGSTVTLESPGVMAFAGGNGGSIPLDLPYRAADGTPINLASANISDLAAYYSTGTLTLSAPQVFDTDGLTYDVQIDPIAGAIQGLDQGSSIILEGLKTFDVSRSTYGTPGVINSAVQFAVQNDGANFAGGLLLANDGSTATVVGNSSTILDSVLGGNSALQTFFHGNPNSIHVRPGAEIINPDGNITLSSTWDFSSGAFYNGGDTSVAGNWDLTEMIYRFGPGLNEPGYLTIRAAGNVVLGIDSTTGEPVSLNDAFAGYDGSDNATLWQAVLLPAGSQSWSFRLVSGADISAADTRNVLSTSALGSNTGSVLLGQNVPALAANPPVGHSSVTIIPQNFQTIRTGTGDIGIYAGGDVQILNNLATVYSAGTQTEDISNFTPPNGDYLAQYTFGGGNVTIVAQGDIEHLTPSLMPDSSKELPMNWLYRRGWIDPTTGQFGSAAGDGIIDSTSWWIDFSNFFEGVAALGGGNVTLIAGGDINNVDALAPTTERTSNQTTVVGAAGTTVDRIASDQPVLELGGGDLLILAGGNIDGGVYYVERGQGSLIAGGSILTNSTRAALSQKQALIDPQVVTAPASWLPTTFFLGQGAFTVSATNDVLLGPVANPFLLPQGSGNGISEKTYFSTFATSDTVSVSSLSGTVVMKDAPDGGSQGAGGTGSLTDWFNLVLLQTNAGSFAQQSQPWLGTLETNVVDFAPLTGLMPASLQATAFSRSIDIVGTLALSPAPDGQVAFAAENSINGVQPNSVDRATLAEQWGSSVINLSDADPARIPSLTNPLSLSFPDIGIAFREWQTTSTVTINAIGSLFAETGSVTGLNAVIQNQQELHGPGPLHANDSRPVQLYAAMGDVSGLTLFAGKSAQIVAGRDITDIALYVQNDRPGDVSVVLAGRDLIAYDPTSALRDEALIPGNEFVSVNTTSIPASGTPTAGDIQIGGPGALEVLAGRNFNLGVGPAVPDGTSTGITSIGNSRDPYLPFGGADIITAAGIGGLSGVASPTPGLAATAIDFSNFIAQYVDPATAGANAVQILPEIAMMLGVSVSADSTPQQTWDTLLAPFSRLSVTGQLENEDQLALDAFYLVLRDTGRDFNDAASPGFGSYSGGYAAIQKLFPGSKQSIGSPSGSWAGNVSLATRVIETTNGGDISVLAPGGQVTVGQSTDPQKPDQGILTEAGGNISIFARDSVDVGTSRIFTLHGGNDKVWSTLGSIAAGSGSRTVHSAPPTRVLIDSQSADVQNDLAGLATGSGIGVLATLSGVAPGSVDLIAPVGTVDAGDAGIRASGTINIAALHVLNASNIQSGGATTGVPMAAAPNIGGLTSASSTAAASSSAANSVAASQQSATQAQAPEAPSLIDVQVLGYGGGDDFPT